MVKFVNRQTEMVLVTEAFRALQNYEDDLLRTPIIDFYGVDGIGKTAFLREIKKQCKSQKLLCISIDASKNAQEFSRAIVNEVRKQHVPLDGQEREEPSDIFQQSMRATRALLKQGTAVMLLDSVDITNEELIKRIAETLREVINDNKLFVVLTSRKSLFFDSERTVSRKLTSFQLKPLDVRSCQEYLEQVRPELEPEIKEYIIDWTRGYPLAIQVMIDAITKNNLDPRDPVRQNELVDLIIERVIDQNVLVRLDEERRETYKAALALLSVPRRFSLGIMQDLIEKFAPNLKRESLLAYMSLPKTLNRDTDVLSWNMFKAGYAVEDPIRNIFLLKNRIEQSEQYFAIHNFLALENERLAYELTGSDRIRHLRDYVYHSTFTRSPQELEVIIKQVIQKIAQESIEIFEQFYEEFLQDEELKDALKEQNVTMLASIYQHLAAMNLQEARNQSGRELLFHLKDYLLYRIQDPSIQDLEGALAQSIEEIFEIESVQDKGLVAAELLASERLEEALGLRYDLLVGLMQRYLQ